MTNSYLVTQATIHDLNDLTPLYDLYRVFYKQSSDLEGAKKFLFDRFNHGESIIFIARSTLDHQAVGFAQLYPTYSSISMKRSWILNDLYVSEEQRKKGIAGQLLNQVKKFALQTKSKGVSLSTAPNNLKAQSLYEKFGFVRDDEFYQYFLDLK